MCNYMNSQLEKEKVQLFVCLFTELLLCNFYWLLSNSSSIDWRPCIILIILIRWIRDLIFNSDSSISSSNSQRREPVIPSLINLSLCSLRPILSTRWIT